MLMVLGLIDVVMISNLLVMVIVGISSIHLLKTFIEVGALGIAWTDRIMSLGVNASRKAH